MDIKELRKARGLTQVQVAKACGVSLSAYLIWERGVGNPSPKNMTKLKRVLSIMEMEELEPLPFTEV